MSFLHMIRKKASEYKQSGKAQEKCQPLLDCIRMSWMIKVVLCVQLPGQFS